MAKPKKKTARDILEEPNGLSASMQMPANEQMTAFMETELNWQPIKLAPADEVVLTKIDDEHGERNIQKLKRRGNLWWTPDDAMYVYYTPTHFVPSGGHG